MEQEKISTQLIEGHFRCDDFVFGILPLFAPLLTRSIALRIAPTINGDIYSYSDGYYVVHHGKRVKVVRQHFGAPSEQWIAYIESLPYIVHPNSVHASDMSSLDGSDSAKGADWT